MRAPVAALTAAFTVGLTAPALAHVDVVRTSPKRGAALKSRPASASITFSGPVIRGTLTVTGPTGKRASVDAGARDPRNVKRVITELRSGLRRGTYRARWTVRGSDGHTQRGSFTFRLRG